MLRAAIKEAHLHAFQQEIDNSSYMVLALITSIVFPLRTETAEFCAIVTVSLVTGLGGAHFSIGESYSETLLF